METLKIFGALFFIGGAYLWTASDDYHYMFDKPIVISYNCNMLLGSWHPDVPNEVINRCKESGRTYVYVKTYQE